jgi:stearoyl-CoA desaturase (delta-9 desaturase)
VKTEGLSINLATVRKQAPKVKLDPSKWEVDAATLQAVIAHRFDVMARAVDYLSAPAPRNLMESVIAPIQSSLSKHH